MLEQLLLSAIEKFEFPRIDLTDYDIVEIEAVRTYNGAESDYVDVEATVYEGGYFNNKLTHEEVNILAVYMIVEWLSQQLASVENTRMKYSGSDFKFTSQANHMQKLLQLKKDYEREGFHLQRLYKRRVSDNNGVKRSTFYLLREPNTYIDPRNNKSQDEEDTIIIYDGGSSSSGYDGDTVIYDGGSSASG
jgi:hypothetical protein